VLAREYGCRPSLKEVAAMDATEGVASFLIHMAPESGPQNKILQCRVNRQIESGAFTSRAVATDGALRAGVQVAAGCEVAAAYSLVGWKSSNAA
jgi:hypothetical protein